MQVAPNKQDSIKLSYESSGYVDNSILPKKLSNFLETYVENLFLRDKRQPQFLHNNQQLPFSFVNGQLIVPSKEFLQIQQLNFQQCYPENILQNCHKIGEGLYGEVFLYKNPLTGGATVMKIIPIEGNQKVNGEKQKKFKEAFSEFIIATELSNLRYNKINNETSSFIEVTNIRCVQGRYPEDLLEMWQLFKETRGSVNDSPEIFNDDQLYLILETNYGGCDLESFNFSNAAEAFSMFLQVSFALAIAEEELRFEHRDLHWGNILLSRIPVNEKVVFKFRGREVKIESYGIKVSIIDYTMSRITLNNVDIYSNLREDCGIFKGSGDYQFEIYKLMQKRNGNEWGHFEAYSNVLWLSYLLDKTITALHYEKPSSKLHKKYLNKLKEFNLEILGCDSAREFVCNLFGNKFL